MRWKVGSTPHGSPSTPKWQPPNHRSRLLLDRLNGNLVDSSVLHNIADGWIRASTWTSDGSPGFVLVTGYRSRTYDGGLQPSDLR